MKTCSYCKKKVGNYIQADYPIEKIICGSNKCMDKWDKEKKAKQFLIEDELFEKG